MKLVKRLAMPVVAAKRRRKIGNRGWEKGNAPPGRHRRRSPRFGRYHPAYIGDLVSIKVPREASPASASFRVRYTVTPAGQAMARSAGQQSDALASGTVPAVASAKMAPRFRS